MLRQRIGGHGGSTCPYCGVPIRFSSRYLELSVFFSLALSLILAYWIGFQAWAGIVWLPTFVICMILARRILALFVPIHEVVSPERVSSSGTNLLFFVCAWLGCTLYMAVYGYLIGLWAFGLGASQQEISEALGLWSIPLGFANSAFIVTSDKPLITDLGIIAANSYFWALVLTMIFKVVHTIFRRNRVIQLSISGTEIGANDDDL